MNKLIARKVLDHIQRGKDKSKAIIKARKIKKCNMVGTQGAIQIRCGDFGRLCPKCYNQKMKGGKTK